MNEREAREALRRAVREDEGTRQRSWGVVQAAYAGHAPRPRRRWGRGAALAAAAALVSAGAVGAAAASAPQSGVGKWVRGVLDVAEPAARPALVRVPGGGTLLVQAGGSAWVVSGDGTKRRLGAYSGAAWSPHGLFVLAWRGRELTALDRGGRVRWSLSRPGRVALARWGPVDGFRIAYLAGAELRMVNGDGTGDRRLGASRPDVAPAWRPDDTHVLAYVDAGDRLSVAAVDSGQRLWRGPRLAGPVQLTWSASGRRLLAVTRRRLLLFDGSGRRLGARAIAAGSEVEAAEWAPRGAQVALVRRSPASGRSDVVLLDARRGLRERVLFAGPGRFGGPAWSPAGGRLLIAWPEADQWLFLRPRGGGRLAAVANIARQFSPRRRQTGVSELRAVVLRGPVANGSLASPDLSGGAGRIACMDRRLSSASLALACAGLAACGAQDEPRREPAPPSTAAVGCAEGGSSPRPLPAGWRRTSVVSGPLTLAYVRQHARQPARAFEPARSRLRRLAAAAPTARERRLARRTLARAAPGSHALAEVHVRVAAGREVTLSVAPAQRSSVGLVYSRRARNRQRRGAPGAYRVADADPAVTFRACPGADTVFLGGFVIAGSRCAAMTVTSPGRQAVRLRVPFGTARCDDPEHLLRRMPYLGVSCPEANSIACDRVGLAVWLRDPATKVTATVNGRPLDLRAGGLGGRPPRYWEGYLQPAGLLDGPLKVTPDRGRHYWAGAHPRDARVVLVIRRRDGATEEAALPVPLAAGWG